MRAYAARFLPSMDRSAIPWVSTVTPRDMSNYSTTQRNSALAAFLFTREPRLCMCAYGAVSKLLGGMATAVDLEQGSVYCIGSMRVATCMGIDCFLCPPIVYVNC